MNEKTTHFCSQQKHRTRIYCFAFFPLTPVDVNFGSSTVTWITGIHVSQIWNLYQTSIQYFSWWVLFRVWMQYVVVHQSEWLKFICDFIQSMRDGMQLFLQNIHLVRCCKSSCIFHMFRKEIICGTGRWDEPDDEKSQMCLWICAIVSEIDCIRHRRDYTQTHAFK